MVQYGGVSTFAVSILVLSSSWTSTPAIADQNDGKRTPTDILTRCVEAIAQVSSMRCDLTILAPTGTESHTDAERDDENRPVHSFVTYWWDRRGFCKVEARDWQPQNVRHLMNGAIYNHYFYTINGQHYRGYSESTRRAKIRSQEHPTRGFMTPLFFLGHEMTDLNENLFEFLQKSGELSSEVVTTAEGYLQISGEYAPINGSYRRTFVVAIDPAQDYLPVQIRTRFKWTGTIDQEIDHYKNGNRFRGENSAFRYWSRLCHSRNLSRWTDDWRRQRDAKGKILPRHTPSRST